MLKKSVMPHLKVKFSLSTIIQLHFSIIKMILDLESACINFVLIESRKLEQKKMPKQHLVSLLKKKGYWKCKLKWTTIQN